MASSGLLRLSFTVAPNFIQVSISQRNFRLKLPWHCVSPPLLSDLHRYPFPSSNRDKFSTTFANFVFSVNKTYWNKTSHYVKKAITFDWQKNRSLHSGGNLGHPRPRHIKVHILRMPQRAMLSSLLLKFEGLKPAHRFLNPATVMITFCRKSSLWTVRIRSFATLICL